MVPVDGMILHGSSSMDEASITGEALPRDVQRDDKVFAGTINITGRLHVEVQKTGEDTSLGSIAGLLQTAAASKAPIVRTVERYAAFYVPAIVLLAAVVFFLTNDLQRVITVFVVSCPCALVLAGPSAMIAAIARSTKLGVLIKNTRFLESVADADTVVFDKTGTITEARLRVHDTVNAKGHTRESLIRYAGQCAAGSSHPVSQAIRRELSQPTAALQLREIPGCGVEAEHDEGILRLGKPEWIHSVASPNNCILPQHIGPVVAVAINDQFLGYILLQDTIRSQADRSVQRLRSLGTKRIVMLTGDRRRASEAVATNLGFDQLISDVLPQDKLAAVEAEKRAGHKVVTVGDGINDALAIAASDVGIVMGERGTDVAIQSADIVLMSNDLCRIPEIIELARSTRNTIFTNIIIAACCGTFMLVLGSTGVLTPITGAIVHNLGTALVLGNSSRLLWIAVDDESGQPNLPSATHTGQASDSNKTEESSSTSIDISPEDTTINLANEYVA